MYPLVFAAGLGMGVLIAAPLGPANILVIRSTLTRGLTAGLVAGLGAVMADSFFAAAVAFGLHQVLDFFSRYSTQISLAGGALLVAIGLYTAMSRLSPEILAAPPSMDGGRKLWRLAATTFSTTITNPGAALGVIAVFGAMASAISLDRGEGRSVAVVAGFVAGGITWWAAISFTIDRLRSRLSVPMLNRINRWTGTLIAAFGFALLLKAAGY